VSQVASTEAGGGDGRPGPYAWYVLGVLLLVYIVNFVDRQLLNAMYVGPLLVGFLNDVLAPRYGDGAIRWSLLGLTVVGVAASLPFWLAGRTLREDLAARDA